MNSNQLNRRRETPASPQRACPPPLAHLARLPPLASRVSCPRCPERSFSNMIALGCNPMNTARPNALSLMRLETNRCGSRPRSTLPPAAFFARAVRRDVGHVKDPHCHLTYLTESVYRVVLQMLIPAQIRQFILYITHNNG